MRRFGALFYDALIVIAIEMLEMLPQSWRSC
ncbi:hypothetical protein EDB48_11499 [Vibrio crassostreae]|nr:hypothetical protein EDB48_11499 [Vibrio crassostreae]